MGKLKKIFFIISISLNITLLGFFIVLLGKIAYHGKDRVVGAVSRAIHPSPPGHSHNKKGEDDYYEDDDEEDIGQELARQLARDIFSESEIRQNFDHLSALHDELILVASATQYDEQKVRDIFTSFGEVFWENKKIIEEKLIVSMKDLTPQKRTGLIKTFLRSRFY